MITYAELCAGYGGLSLGIEQAIPDTQLAWYAEFDEAPSRIMAHHWPGIPNVGDISTTDWAALPPVDLISGGTPCQDVSAAGRRAGMVDGTRSNLWAAMREAIATIKPQYVIWENVAGVRSANAHSDLEPCPGCMGNHRPEHSLRALGRVLGDLATLGFHAEWRSITAASVGAPHRRERVFIFAWQPGAPAPHTHRGGSWGRADTPGGGSRERVDATPLIPAGAHDGTGPADQIALLGTPRAADGMVNPLRDSEAIGAPPTPRASHGDKGGPNQRDSAGHYDLPAIGNLLPTPNAYLAKKGGSHHPDKIRAGGHMVDLTDVVEHAISPTHFGPYASAVERWEQVSGRPAPPPTELSPRGKHRLSEHFTEWMMGLPEGWICDTEGISRNDKIKAAGNGVLPLQAATAIVDMIHHKDT